MNWFVLVPGSGRESTTGPCGNRKIPRCVRGKKSLHRGGFDGDEEEVDPGGLSGKMGHGLNCVCVCVEEDSRISSRSLLWENGWGSGVGG